MGVLPRNEAAAQVLPAQTVHGPQEGTRDRIAASDARQATGALRWGWWQHPALVSLAVGLIYLGLLAWLWQHFGGDPVGFVHEGSLFTDRDPNGTHGYDGQFYYYTALHPLHASALMDNAAFRLERIFYPLLIIGVTLGQRPLMAAAMVAINWIAVVGGTGVVAVLLRRWGRSPWFALSYALASGIPVALTFDTAEPLTFALVALGIAGWGLVGPSRQPQPEGGSRPAGDMAGRQTGWLGGGLAFAAALLTRELAVFAVAGYGAAGLVRRDWRTVASAALTFLPFLVWSSYISLEENYLGVSYAQPLEHIPFLAYWLQLDDPTLRSVGYASQYVIPTLVFGGLGMAALVRTWRAPSPLLLGMLGNAALMTFIHRGGYQHQVAISRYMLGLTLAAVLWAATVRPRWVLWLTPLFAASLLGYLYGLVTQDPAYLW